MAFRGPSGPLEAFLESWGPSKVLRALLGPLLDSSGPLGALLRHLRAHLDPYERGGGAHTFLFLRGPQRLSAALIACLRAS